MQLNIRRCHLIFTYITMTLIILSSRTILSNMYPIEWIMSLYGVVLMLYNKKIYIKNFILLLGFILFRFVLQILQLNPSLSFVSATISTFFALLTITQFSNCVSRKEAAQSYVNILFVLSAISLVCYILLMVLPNNIIYSFAQFNGYYRHSYIYLWGVKNINGDFLFTRNSGIWWEPGGYLCFIAFAFFMIDSGWCDQLKNLRVKVIILLITWITTQSTTGYLIFLIAMMLMHNKILSIIFNNSVKDIPTTKKIIFICIGIIIIFYVYNKIAFNNILEKLSANNASFVTRFNDIISTFKISIINPAIGVGQDFLKYYQQYGIKDNSAAILHIATLYGWIYVLTYLILLWKGIKRFFSPIVKNKQLHVCIMTILIIFLGLTEGIVELPVFLLFFSYYQDKDYFKKTI